MSREDKQPVPFHGLVEQAKREGARRLKDTRRGNAFLSERTVFRDTATGHIAWRVTCDPAVSVNDYYDIPGWNANGSVMGFLSRRTGGGRKRWLMDANGDNLRPMPTADKKPINTGFWSMRYPDRFYHAIVDEKGTHIVAENPFTGEREAIASVNRDLGQMMPPHPSEEWFLFGDKEGNEEAPAGVFPPDMPSVAYVVGLDGAVQEVHFERRWHRLRFTKSADRRLFFNFDDPRTQWTILPDGTDRHEIPYTGGHPDWPMDGSELTYYDGGHVWGVSYKGENRRSVIHLDSGGHGGPCLDGEWFVSDTPQRGRYPGAIICFRTDGSEECRVLFKHMSSLYSHNERGWHPDHHATHPHPNSSPDGTKVVFNSDFMGEYADLYIVVNRLPDPPQNLMMNPGGDRLLLNWEVPRRCHETKGYHIYRRDEHSGHYVRLTEEPVEGTKWSGPRTSGYYVVTAQEWSGLESEPSREVGANGERGDKVRVALDTTAPGVPEGVQVEAVSANTLRIHWSGGGDSDLDHYNVYSSQTSDFVCRQETLVGSPSSAEFVDWGLALNTAYYYRITAVDRAGNESAPSEVVGGKTPAFDPVRIELMPEDAEVLNMGLQKVEVGQALYPRGSGVATWTFEVPRDGDYAIWGRSIRERPKDEHVGRVRADTLDVYFDLCVDDDLEIQWTAWGYWGEWHWSPAGNLHTGTPEVFRLTAGTHTLCLKPGTPTALVAGLVVTDDSTWWPVEGMRSKRRR